MFKNNLLKLREKMNENNIDLAVITDDDNLYYFTGYHDFLHMDFNRPTILLVPKDDESTLITPLLDVLLVPEDTPVGNIVTWNDGIGDEWREFLPKFIKQNKYRKIPFFISPISNKKKNIYESLKTLLNSNVKCLDGITFETAYAKLGLVYKSFKNEKKRNQFLTKNNFFEKIPF